MAFSNNVSALGSISGGIHLPATGLYWSSTQCVKSFSVFEYSAPPEMIAFSIPIFSMVFLTRKLSSKPLFSSIS